MSARFSSVLTVAAGLNGSSEPKHFHDKVVPELRQIPGFVGAQLSRRLLHEKIEFLVPTRWQSIDAIREFGTTVRHYEATRAD